MAASAGFEIQQTQHAGWARLSVVGELDLLTARTFRRRFRALKATNTNVSIDLSLVDFIDSAGVHALEDAIADARPGSCRVEVEPNVSAQVRRVFERIDGAGVQTEFGGRLGPARSQPPPVRSSLPRRL